MAAGRPTKYNRDMVKQATHYTDNYRDYGDTIPSIASLTLVLGVHRDTIYQWVKDGDKPEFSDTVERLMAMQEVTLINGGLKGEFNSMICKLLLFRHGYHDKNTLDLTSSDRSLSPNRIEIVAIEQQPLTPEQVKAELIKRGLPLNILD